MAKCKKMIKAYDWHINTDWFEDSYSYLSKRRCRNKARKNGYCKKHGGK